MGAAIEMPTDTPGPPSPPEPAVAGLARGRGTWRAALLYAVLTVALTIPLSLRPGSRMLPTGPDGDLFVWTFAWNAHAFLHQPLSIFDANIYHPRRHTLAYSENLIGSAVIAAPVIWATGNPVLATNVVALLSCLLCGLGTYVLARRVGLGHAGAVVAGVVFAFAPPRFLRLGQLHLTTVQWLPFGLMFLHAYLDGGRRRDLRLAAGTFSLQALTSGHGAVFLAVAMSALCGYRLLLGEPRALGRRARDLGLTGAVLLLPAVLVLVPYRTLQSEVGLTRTLDNWEATASSFVASPAHVHARVLQLLGHADILGTASAYLFPGYLPILLASSALVLGTRRRDAPPVASRHDGSGAGWRPGAVAARGPAGWRRLAAAAELIAVACVGLALYVTAYGPVRLRWHDTVLLSVRNAQRAWMLSLAAGALRVALARVVPVEVGGRLRRGSGALAAWARSHRRSALVFYALLLLLGLWLSVGSPVGLWPYVYRLPGFNFIRVPSRFTIMALLGLAVLSGIGFERAAARCWPRRPGAPRAAVALVVALLVAEFALAPLETVPARMEVPPVDRWLAGRPTPFVVAEVPLPDPRHAGAFERRQVALMLHATAHWQKTVHGYSGIRPPEHTALYEALRRFPDEDSLRQLAAFGVTYIVVHTAWYATGEWEAVAARLGGFADRLRLEHVEGEGRVYSLRSAAVRPAPSGARAGLPPASPPAE